MTRVGVWDPVVRILHWSLAAGFVANALVTDPDRIAHARIGYGLVGLVALRLLWGVIGTRHARFADFPPSPSAALGQLAEMATGRRHVHAGHSPLGALMVYNLLATIALLGLTGHMMTTAAFFGADWVEELHEALATWAALSVALHVAAVVFESRRLGINLPKSMLTGYKSLHGDRKGE